MAIESLFFFLFILQLLLSPAYSLCPLPPMVVDAVGNTGHDKTGGNYIEYTCIKGYYIYRGDSRLKCSNGTIDGNLPTCMKKRCQSLFPGSRVHISSLNTEYGSPVWVNCEKGYKMSSDNSVKLKLVCVDGNHTAGKWSSPMPDCSLITCRNCITLSHGKSNCSPHRTYNYNNKVEYWCDSGYMAYGNNILTCGDKGAWKTGSRMTCNASKTYFGCYTMVNATSASTNINECRLHCQTKGYHYAGYNNAGCACRNSLTSTLAATNQCKERCSIGGKVTCGGTGNVRTAHYSFYGCYEDSAVQTVAVQLPADSTKTCIQYCRWQNTSYALLLHSDQCSCVDVVSKTARPVPANRCQYRNSTDVYFVRIVELEKIYSSCNSLYNAGVRYHGEYVLGPKRQVKRCHFKDGTPCDHEWIGYRGACYHFNPDQRIFSDSLKYCAGLNSDVVSIHDRNEVNFLKTTITDLMDLKNQANWIIGLYDNFRSSNYIWSDGTLKVFNDFVQDHPSRNNWPCVYLTKDGWEDKNCLYSAGLICKKKQDANQCLKLSKAISQSSHSTEEPNMNPGLCFQTCRGLKMKVSAVNNATCRCYENMPTHSVLNWTECSNYCNPNTHQNCGGGQNVFFVTQESGQPTALSCYELQLQEMANPFTTDSAGVALCSGNETNSCPRTWLASQNSCYKFFESRVVYKEAVKQCIKNNAYIVSINDADEEIRLFEMIQKISMFRSISRWWIGLTNQQRLGVYRWSDGRQVSYNKVTGTTDQYVYWIPSTKTWKTHNSYDAFICEKDPAFSGCYHDTSQTDTATASDDMTVNMCVELCRGKLKQFALLKSVHCYCADSVTNRTSCNPTDTCKAQPNQLCGKDPVFAVYKVDEYEKFANNCQDLLFEGIHTPAFYVLRNGGKNCNFRGNVDICPAGSNQWIGFKGKCYLFDGDETKTWVEAQNVCLSIGSTLASIRDDQDVEFLTKSIKPRYSLTYKKTIWLGGSDEIYNGFYNWIDGNLLSSNQSKTIGTGEQHHLAFLKPNYKLTKTREKSGYVLCQKTKDYRGCFQAPAILPSHTKILVTDNLVSVNLCKQLCLGRNFNYSLTNQKSCACTSNISSLISVDNKRCQNPCPSRNILSCGYQDTWALHQLDNSGLAISCSQLAINGIFLNATYKLWNSATNSTELKQCGQADDTSCPIGWVGKDGICYYFSTQKTTLPQARKTCFSKSAILSFPIDAVARKFIIDMVNSVPTIWNSGKFFVSVQTFNRGSYVVAATGRIIKPEPDIPTPFNQLTLSSSNTYSQPSSTSKEYFICERFSGYRGCAPLSSQQQSVSISSPTMTGTQCLEFCRGQEFSMAAVNTTSCYCLKSDNVLSWRNTTATEGCFRSCPGFYNQPCGGNSLFSVYEADPSTPLPDSCDELVKLGVTEKSMYKLQPNNQKTVLKTTCFSTGGYAESIQPTNYIFTSKQKSFTTTDLRVHIFPTMTGAWEPTSVNGQWVEVAFHSLYVVTGIRTRGIMKPHQRWVKSYELFHGDKSPGYLAPYSENNITQANTDGNSVVTRLFRKPFVANTIRLVVKQSFMSIALGFDFLGQPYQSALVSNTSIGCFADDNSKGIVLANVSTKADCKTTCLAKGYPIYGIQENKGTFVCKCVLSFGKYGQLNDIECHNGSNIPSFILHRTFEISCQAPPTFHWAKIKPSSSPVGEKYAYYTEVKYTCIPGYEFPDKSNSSIIKCQQNNQWESLLGNCSRKQCPAIPKVDRTTTDTNDTLFGSKVTFRCQSGFMFPNHRTSITLECLADGTWNTTVPSCIALKCREPSTPENSKLTAKNNTHATFICNEGSYFSDGLTTKSFICQQNMKWAFNGDKCEAPDPFRREKSVSKGESNKRIAVPYQSLNARGLLDCISKCMMHMSCSMISLHTKFASGGVNCDLFLGRQITLTDAPGWNMYYLK